MVTKPIKFNITCYTCNSNANLVQIFVDSEERKSNQELLELIKFGNNSTCPMCNTLGNLRVNYISDNTNNPDYTNLKLVENYRYYSNSFYKLKNKWLADYVDLDYDNELIKCMEYVRMDSYFNYMFALLINSSEGIKRPYCQCLSTC